MPYAFKHNQRTVPVVPQTIANIIKAIGAVRGTPAFQTLNDGGTIPLGGVMTITAVINSRPLPHVARDVIRMFTDAASKGDSVKVHYEHGIAGVKANDFWSPPHGSFS